MCVQALHWMLHRERPRTVSEGTDTSTHTQTDKRPKTVEAAATSVAAAAGFPLNGSVAVQGDEESVQDSVAARMTAENHTLWSAITCVAVVTSGEGLFTLSRCLSVCLSVYLYV